MKQIQREKEIDDKEIYREVKEAYEKYPAFCNHEPEIHERKNYD